MAMVKNSVIDTRTNNYTAVGSTQEIVDLIKLKESRWTRSSSYININSLTRLRNVY